MNLHARLLTISEIIHLSTDVVRAQSKKMLLISVISLLFTQLVNIYVSGSNIIAYKQPEGVTTWISFVLYIFIILVALTASVALVFITKYHLENKEISIADSIRKALSKLLPLIGFAVVVGLAVALIVAILIVVALLFGALLAGVGEASNAIILLLAILAVPVLIVVAISVVTYLFFTNHAIILDNSSVFSSFGRSISLVKGYFWPTLGFLVLAVGVNMVLGMVIVVINLLLIPLLMLSSTAANLISLIFTVPVTAIINTVMIAAVTVFYLNRKAVLQAPSSSAQILAVESGTPAQDIL